MPVTLQNPKIAYFPVPKVACTSLKLLFYRLRFGKPFEAYARNGQEVHIHNHSVEFGTTAFLETDLDRYVSHLKIAVVRDPVQRILSAYTNRVVNLGELRRDRVDGSLLDALGVPADPNVDTFFDSIDAYRIVSPSIRHHVEPATTFLGPDLCYFDRVYRLDELSELRKDLESRVGHEIELPNEQRSQNLVSWESLSPATRRRLLEFVMGDYALLRDFYAPPTL